MNYCVVFLCFKRFCTERRHQLTRSDVGLSKIMGYTMIMVYHAIPCYTGIPIVFWSKSCQETVHFGAIVPWWGTPVMYPPRYPTCGMVKEDIVDLLKLKLWSLWCFDCRRCWKKVWQRRRSAKMAKIKKRLEATYMVNCKSNKSGLTIFAATTYLQVQIFSFHGPKYALPAWSIVRWSRY